MVPDRRQSMYSGADLFMTEPRSIANLSKQEFAHLRNQAVSSTSIKSSL